MGSCMSAIASTISNYNLQKYLVAKSWRIGIINWFIKILVVSYIIGYAIIYNHGYQDTDIVVGSVTTKVRGVLWGNISHLTHMENEDESVFDVADYVIPPQQNKATFVMTRAAVTPMQKQGVCDEDPAVIGALCKNDHSCPPYGEPMMRGNGLSTGKCVNSTKLGLEHKKVCQVRAWCPTESKHQLTDKSLLRGAEKLSIFIKNSIEFPKFNKTKRNIESFKGTEDDMWRCRWIPRDKGKQTLLENEYCPIFWFEDILREIKMKEGGSPDDYDKMLADGATIGVHIRWDCNLDFSMDYCHPVYSFRRMYNEDKTFARGLNFRFARYYLINNTLHRTLTKAFGLKFVVLIVGTGRMFDIIHMIRNFANGLALLGVSVIVCDFLIKNCHPKRKKYLAESHEMETI